MTSSDLPYESHIQSLFAFALGLISGAAAMNRIRRDQPLSKLEDLPEAFVFAGGGMDEMAGDAFMRSDNQWFVIEMKRGPLQLADERKKPRVIELRRKLFEWQHSVNAFETALRGRSQTAHQFIYGCKRVSGGPAIRAQSYSKWLQNEGRVESEDLVSFLERVIGGAKEGFTLEQLVFYVASMNSREGGPPPEDFKAFIGGACAMAINSAGEMTVYTMKSIEGLLNRLHAGQRARAAAVNAPTQAQEVAPPAPSSSPRPRP